MQIPFAQEERAARDEPSRSAGQRRIAPKHRTPGMQNAVLEMMRIMPISGVAGRV